MLPQGITATVQVTASLAKRHRCAFIEEPDAISRLSNIIRTGIAPTPLRRSASGLLLDGRPAVPRRVIARQRPVKQVRTAVACFVFVAVIVPVVAEYGVVCKASTHQGRSQRLLVGLGVHRVTFARRSPKYAA